MHQVRSSWRAVLRDVLIGAVGYGSLSTFVVWSGSFGVIEGSALWPGSGFTLGLLLLLPRRRWPALLIGVAAAEVGVDAWFGFSIPMALGMALANVSEPLLAATLLRWRTDAPPDLRRHRDVVRFVLAAVLAGPALGAFVGTAAGVLLSGDPWTPRLGRWFVGDAIGVLIVAPVLLTWSRAALARTREAALSWLGLAVLLGIAFGPWNDSVELGLRFLVVPAVIVLALYGGSAAGAFAVLAVTLASEVATEAGFGPLAGSESVDPMVAVQIYVATVSVTSLLATATLGELVQRTKSEAEARASALVDDLTGLANRRLLRDRLSQAALRAGESGGLAVAVVDLDGLKVLNDTWGHAAGDEVLRTVAARLAEVIRPLDTAARTGGDEFVLVCEGVATTDSACAVGERVADAVRLPIAWQEHLLAAGASVGIAVAAGPTIDAGFLLQEADAAMYEAKRAGGGVRVVTQGTLDPAPDRRP